MTNKSSINEYIYFDDQEIISILAQLENGYPSKLTSTFGDSKTTKDSKSVNADVKGSAKNKVPFVAEGQLQGGIGGKHEHTIGNANLSQNAVDSEYEDYALNVIEEELHDELSDNIRNKKLKEGALVKFRSRFNILDLKKLKDLYNSKEFFNVSISDKQSVEKAEEDKKQTENFKNLVTVLNIIYSDSTLLKADDSIIIAKDNKMRMSHSQLPMINFTNRRMVIFGRVESIIDKNKQELDNLVKEESGIEKMMPNLSLSLLSNLLGMEKGNRLIKPIAIYFT